jgi:hypothetical protein
MYRIVASKGLIHVFSSQTLCSIQWHATLSLVYIRAHQGRDAVDRLRADSEAALAKHLVQAALIFVVAMSGEFIEMETIQSRESLAGLHVDLSAKQS